MTEDAQYQNRRHATDAPDILEFIAVGVDVFRLNCSIEEDAGISTCSVAQNCLELIEVLEMCGDRMP